MEGLTAKREIFAQEYIKNGGNGTQAALIAFDTKDYMSAAVTASRVLKDTKVQAVIEKARAHFRLRSYRAARKLSLLSEDAKSEYVQLEATKEILDRAGVVKPQALAIDNRSLTIHISGESATRYSLASSSTPQLTNGVVTTQANTSSNIDRMTDRGVLPTGGISGGGDVRIPDTTPDLKKVRLTKQEDSGEDWEL